MYNYCKEILKHGLPAPGLEPSINWLSARSSSPLSQLHFDLKKWDININIIPSKLSSNFVEIAVKLAFQFQLIHTLLIKYFDSNF